MTAVKQYARPEPRRFAGAVQKDAHELHIRMVGCDPRIANHLQLAASALAMEARRTDDLRLARILLDACARIAAVSRVHDRLQALDLGNQVELARLLPELCEELRMCLDAQADAEAPDALCLVASELVVTAANEGAHGAGVCVRLEHDGRGARRLSVGDGEGKADGAGLRLLRAFTARFGGALQSAPLPRGASISVLLD